MRKKYKIILILLIISIILLLYLTTSVSEGFQNEEKNVKIIMNGIESGFFFNFNRLIHYLVVHPNTKEVEYNVRAQINNHLPFIGENEELFSKLFENYKEDVQIDETLNIDKYDWKGIPFSGGDGSKFYNENRIKFEPYYNAFKKFIKLKPALQKKVDKKIEELHNDSDEVIGIFVRSNALANEQPKRKMPRPEDYDSAIQQINKSGKKIKYFLRIDNNEDLNYYKNKYKPNYFLNMKRADTNKGDAPHSEDKKFLPLEELENIYIEIALLSSCNYIVHCSSNMVSSALFMNMNAKSIFVENNE
jgi:hypothetical protein